MPLLSVGHGGLDRTGLGALLTGAGVETVVDVRRYPGSRRNPDVAQEALASWLPGADISYRWEERLGGRRYLNKVDDALSPDTWWQVKAFRAYAGYTRTGDFRAALAQVIEEARGAQVAVMCSETVWWRCHRRIIADVVMLTTGVPVAHVMPDGTVRPHRPADGAVVRDGEVVWEGVPSVRTT